MKVYIEDTFNEDGELKGKLYLESDSMQFMLREYNGKFDKNGYELSKTLGYYTNVKSALTALIKLKVMQSTATTLTELHEDIRRIEQSVSLNFDWNVVTSPTEAVEAVSHE